MARHRPTLNEMLSDCRGKRSIGFTCYEIDVIAKTVHENWAVINGAFSPSLTKMCKDGAWKSVAAACNTVSPVPRSTPQVKEKWKKMKSLTRLASIALDEDRSRTDGGPPTARSLTSVEKYILTFIRDQPRPASLAEERELLAECRVGNGARTTLHTPPSNSPTLSESSVTIPLSPPFEATYITPDSSLHSSSPLHTDLDPLNHSLPSSTRKLEPQYVSDHSFASSSPLHPLPDPPAHSRPSSTAQSDGRRVRWPPHRQRPLPSYRRPAVRRSGFQIHRGVYDIDQHVIGACQEQMAAQNDLIATQNQSLTDLNSTMREMLNVMKVIANNMIHK